MKKVNLAIIYVEYKKDQYKDSFKKIQAYLQKIRFCNKTYIIVDNSQEGKNHKKISENTYWIEGDNEDREFSGWQRGINLLDKLEIPFHIVLFANEAFEAVTTSFLKKRATIFLLWRALFFNSVIGAINSPYKKITLFHYDVSSWICTNCFFVPKKILNSLGRLWTLRKADMDIFFEKTFPLEGDMFKPEAPLNEEYKNHIREWLTERWHSKFEIDQEMWGFFREKTRAILNEALLTARIREKNFRVKDYRIFPDPRSVLAAIYRNIRKVLG